MARESAASETPITVTGRSDGPKRTTTETAETEFVVGDARYKGGATDSRAGFGSIRAYVTADADALADRMAEVEERCPVADNLRAGTDVHVEVERA